jgi:large subunit ribosomal protein L3
MGAARVTTQNLQVIKTDVDLGIIMIKGAVPGSKGGWVTIKDAVKKDQPDNVIYPAALLSASKPNNQDANKEEDNTANSVELSVNAESPTEQNNKNIENTVSVPESSPEGGKENES